MSITKATGVFVASLVNRKFVGILKFGMMISPYIPYVVYERTVQIDNSGCNFGTTSEGF